MWLHDKKKILPFPPIHTDYILQHPQQCEYHRIYNDYKITTKFIKVTLST